MAEVPMGVRCLTDAPLRVEPRLLGTPLASPLRRLAAFGVDGALLVVPTVVAASAAALLALYVRDRPAFDAGWNLVTGRAATAAAREDAYKHLLPVLLDADAKGLPHEVAALVEAGRTDEALAELADYDIRLTLGNDHAQLAPKTIQVNVEEVIPGVVRGMAVFFVPGSYFAFFTRGRRGATLGKRLVGIRVLRLDGHPLSALEALERFIGYLEIPGTFFVGLLDLWKDPNRRMAHDRVAHTAVVRTPNRTVQAAQAVEAVQDVQGVHGRQHVREDQQVHQAE